MSDTASSAQMDMYKAAYIDGWKKYVDFSSRASKLQFWTFFFINLAISIVLSIIDQIIGISILSSLFALALIIPYVAIFIRRLHDQDKTGWFALLLIIPLVNLVALIIFGIAQPNPASGPNQYGPEPTNL